MTTTETNSVITSTDEQQTDLSLTVYNGNRALVSQSRKIPLTKGEVTLRYSDIAAEVMPQTVTVEANKGLFILEQNYEYDLISQQKLLEKYVGKEISIVQENPYTDKQETKTAKLLALNGEPVFEMDGSIHLGIPGRMVLPELPENLYAKPTMNWILQNQKEGDVDLSLSYLTNGISWIADYVLNLSDDEKSATLTGWVTLTNNAGTNFNNARLKLVAGDVNQIQPQMDPFAVPAMSSMDVFGMSEPEPVEEKEFFDYHLYTFPRKVNVRNRQIKQLSLLTAEGVKTVKKYSVTQDNFLYRNQYDEQELPVSVTINLKTGKRNKIDMPIPAGIIRLYKKDSDGSAVFVGEDHVKHTPINEKISLKTGDAFDIKVEGRQVNYEEPSEKEHRSSYEVEIRNHKKSAVTVEVLVPLSGVWTISDAPEYRKVTAQQIAFDVKVPASGETKLNYTVSVKSK